jgi:glycerol-3-phosphate dehydrogenase (NAD(P)+)
MKRIAIIGDGGWGTALGLVLLQRGCRVRLWGPFPDYIEQLRRERENKLYLPGVPLPEALEWTADRDEAVDGAEGIILAVPSKFCRAVYESFAGRLPSSGMVLSVGKGLDAVTRRRLTEVAEELLGWKPVAALSGPSHAEEVVRGIPTAVVVACAQRPVAEAWRAVFTGPRFRVYTAEDVIGVELGGALKNIVAIAAGASDGLGFGDNTRAALMTRGLAEITRLGTTLGAQAETFSGLSGVGDLIVTCSSRWSRNRRVGERLGRGESVEQILGGMKQVAEGVTTCAVARELARARNLRAPITEEVYAVIHEGKQPALAVGALMARDARPERD